MYVNSHLSIGLWMFVRLPDSCFLYFESTTFLTTKNIARSQKQTRIHFISCLGFRLFLLKDYFKFWQKLGPYIFLVLSHFILFLLILFIATWAFAFCCYFSFVTIWVLSFVTIWVFVFCHNLSFRVLSLFEFLTFVTIKILSFVSIWVL